MTTLAISAAHARRFLVRRQLLAPPRALPAEPASVLAVIARLGSLQFDPLEYPGARNHDLVLHARVARYERAWCDGWLYGEARTRRLFEAYNKSLNILPIDELPYYRLAWARAEERYKERVFARRKDSVSLVLGALREQGPLPTSAFAEKLPGAIDWHWAKTAEGRAVLEALFECGRVALARREGSRRFYDLSERLFPAELLAKRVTDEDAARHRLLSRYRGVGLAGASGGAELFFSAGKATERARVLARLVDEAVLVPIAVEGLRGARYVLAEEREVLAASEREDNTSPPGVTFLAPLDPLVWDRRLLRDLFGFEYIWEVYTPEAKRKHGYYVLPVLFGSAIVGRIEPRMDRATSTLHLLGAWFEKGFDPAGAPGFLGAFREALEAYRVFVGADRVRFGRSRALTLLARAQREPAASDGSQAVQTLTKTPRGRERPRR